MAKKSLGQFYTTNYAYILQNLSIPPNTQTIIEPFVGQGDLLKFAGDDKVFECYDIDPKIENATIRDTLIDPPDYCGKFVLTNPPYLARNKSNDKKIFDKYDQNDLFKCFISELISNVCDGGIIIIPLNFWSSIRKTDIELRQRFLTVYEVMTLNIFEEKVFNDTSYTVCSFRFQKANGGEIVPECFIYPGGKKIEFNLTEENHFMVGGEIYSLPQSKAIKVERLTRLNIKSQNKTHILAKCIDDTEPINLRIVSDKEVFIDRTEKLSARSYATLVITPKISKEKEETLVAEFNTFLDEKRKKYNSLFLSNYRESTITARKRISFGLIFKIVNYLLSIPKAIEPIEPIEPKGN
ncbi:MAG: hypothetical protein KAS12_01395 [Candidatus Aenigmarchaeota archaeon]|nr:hypothetical protein [Candidatus Aenigmarchaeota archaeon]